MQHADDLSLQIKSFAWRPAPIIYISAALHLCVVIAIIIQPKLWPWLVAIIVGNHLLITVSVLFPKGKLLGPNETRLPKKSIHRNEIALTFDDGPDHEITPQVLDLLDRYQAKASFFCIGEKVTALPHIVKEIIKRGHSVENHTDRHPHAFSFYGLSRLNHEVETAQLKIARMTGSLPMFFRAPAGFRSPFLDPIMAKNGLRYVSWTRRALDGTGDNPKKALARLLNGLSAGDILLLHDGTKVRTKDGKSVVLTVLPSLLDAMAQKNLKAVSLVEAFGESL